ncbi:MAG: APC family permease [Candidatus Acidiferrales bacterium]
MSATDATITETPHLVRALGQWDLVLLFVVAVANLNIVPVVAAGGAVTIWLWLLALLLFFWPQGIAVIELSNRYPNEGGVYLWTKEIFGNFHGFLSGWCYWTNNVFYIPTLLLYMVGISVYVGGAQARGLGNSKIYVFVMALALLWVLVWLNIRGLGVGKWINNLGGVGTFITAAALIGLAAAILSKHGSSIHPSDFRVTSADWHLVNLFGIICFGLVGLELASVMGDEIRDPKRTLPRAVFWGGVISGLLFVGTTLAVLLALPQEAIGAVQGLLQAVTRMADDVGIAWIGPGVALVLTLAIAGTASAWFSGSARIPFVAGLDHYLPSGLGRVHPRYSTPYVALIVHAVLSSAFIAMSFVGASVEEAYKIMLLLATVLQLVPFLYMFAALIRLANASDFQKAVYSRGTILAGGISGIVATAVGMIVAFWPQTSGQAVWLFELKMGVGCAFFILLAVFFFFIYSRRTPAGAAVPKRVQP